MTLPSKGDGGSNPPPSALTQGGTPAPHGSLHAHSAPQALRATPRTKDTQESLYRGKERPLPLTGHPEERVLGAPSFVNDVFQLTEGARLEVG
jgi:hypothetical protein